MSREEETKGDATDGGTGRATEGKEYDESVDEVTWRIRRELDACKDREAERKRRAEGRAQGALMRQAESERSGLAREQAALFEYRVRRIQADMCPMAWFLEMVRQVKVAEVLGVCQPAAARKWHHSSRPAMPTSFQRCIDDLFALGQLASPEEVTLMVPAIMRHHRQPEDPAEWERLVDRVIGPGDIPLVEPAAAEPEDAETAGDGEEVKRTRTRTRKGGEGRRERKRTGKSKSKGEVTAEWWPNRQQQKGGSLAASRAKWLIRSARFAAARARMTVLDPRSRSAARMCLEKDKTDRLPPGPVLAGYTTSIEITPFQYGNKPVECRSISPRLPGCHWTTGLFLLVGFFFFPVFRRQCRMNA
jgi:hypothetical protein